VSNDVTHSSCLKPIALPVWLAASSCCNRFSLISYGLGIKSLPSNHHSTRRTIGFMHQLMLITRTDTSIPAVCYACRLWCPLLCHKWVLLNWYLSTLGQFSAWGEGERPVLLRCLAVSADASSNQTCRRTLFIHKNNMLLTAKLVIFVFCDFPR